MNQGVQAYRSARYDEAAADFQKAVDLDPYNVTARLYLATVYMTRYVPGSDDPENIARGERAKAEFESVLQVDPSSVVALESLASLSYRRRKLDEARDWYQRVLQVSPRNREAYYSLGVIDWMKFYPNLMAARKQLGMRPEDPGPLPDPLVRQDLNAKYGAIIADGIANLEKALDIDPQYGDAMAYLNLLIRERADLRDTADDYKQDIAAADQWVQKALETKRTNAQGGGIVSGIFAPGPQIAPPPPPHPRRPDRHRNVSASAAMSPQRAWSAKSIQSTPRSPSRPEWKARSDSRPLSA